MSIVPQLNKYQKKVFAVNFIGIHLLLTAEAKESIL